MSERIIGLGVGAGMSERSEDIIGFSVVVPHEGAERRGAPA